MPKTLAPIQKKIKAKYMEISTRSGLKFKGICLLNRLEQITGTGLLTYANGAQYEGELKKSVPHGQGTKKFHLDDEKQINQYKEYKGSWVHGRIEGIGELIMTQGESYQGEFVNGFPHGHGKRTW